MDLFRHFDDDDDPKIISSSVQRDNPKTEVRRLEFKKDKCEKYGIYPRSSKGYEDDDASKTSQGERLVNVSC